MLIIGCGYVGTKLGARLAATGERVVGTITSEARRAELEAVGIEPRVLDLDAPDQGPLPDGHVHVFHLAPPPGAGVEAPRTARLLERLDHPVRLVYMSTSGVYGDCGGDWIDETRPVDPTTERAKRRLDAERRVWAWRERTGGEAVVLRVAGIYGPGRLPLERLQRGEPMLRAEDCPWTNRIHVDDLVEVCIAAMDRGGDGEIYNVSDGTPGTMAQYFAAVADAAGLARPPELTLAEARDTLSPGLMSYLGQSRRLDITKLKTLGVRLRHGTLVSGLQASL